MSNRHLARTVAMQSLFEWDFTEEPTITTLDSIVTRNLAQFAPGLEDDDFAKELTQGVVTQLPEIDKTITTYAPEWPLDQITPVDRNILRIGVYEMLHSESVPGRVAINEAIEIAKKFSGESSGKFVNGVLGAIYKKMVDEGKLKPVDLIPPKKERAEQVAHG